MSQVTMPTSHATHIPRRVVKLGGSLLAMPNLVPRLRRWLDAEGAAETLLLVGGGGAVDAIRAADAQRRIPDADAHWLCVRAMQMNAELLVAWLSEAEPILVVEALIGRPVEERLVVVDPWLFLADEEPRLSVRPLPESWDVTSDSIAARLADVVSAEELVLLKSALPQSRSLARLARDGYVDRYFPVAAGNLRHVRLVNFRDREFCEMAIDPRAD